MAVVKFSILTLLAGGFCTLLGIGMWMGPQDASCNAETGVTTVASETAAALPSCYYVSDDVVYFPPAAASPATCSSRSACESVACEASGSASGQCQSASCDLVATIAPAAPNCWQTQAPAPQSVVTSIPAAAFNAFAIGGPCESGVCAAPAAVRTPGSPCPPATAWAPSVSYPQAPAVATTSFYHVAPCAGPECPPPGYAAPYGYATYAAPMPAVSPSPSYQDAEQQTSDQPSMEMIEAFMQERERRYEAQIEALETVTELKLEAQAAMLKAEHQVAMTQLKAEAMVKFATMEQALREEKALLELVADGTLTTDALRSIIAKNHANGNGGSAQPVSTSTAGACEKCGQSEVSAVSAECKCDGDCCPACEQAVSTAAPPCEACKASACATSACATAACAKCGDCKACDATTVVSVRACESCDACVKACGDCQVAGTFLECDALTVSADGKACTIIVGAKAQGCPASACQADQCTTGKCTTGECKIGECKTGECKTGKCEGCPASEGDSSVISTDACPKCKACPTGECPAKATEEQESPVVEETKNRVTVTIGINALGPYVQNDANGPFLSELPILGHFFAVPECSAEATVSVAEAASEADAQR